MKGCWAQPVGMKQPSLSSSKQGNETHSQGLQACPPSLRFGQGKGKDTEERKAE